MKATVASLALAIMFCGLGVAQELPPPGEEPSRPMPRMMPPRAGDRGLGQGEFQTRRKWWKDSALMKRIGVTDEQVQKIESIFQDHRLRLIDMDADLQKQEATLEPMIEADQPDEGQVIAQIDKVAQARANLEKSNAQMLLAIRRVLTVDQWQQLRNLPGVSPFRGGPRPGPPVQGFPHAMPPAPISPPSE